MVEIASSTHIPSLLPESHGRGVLYHHSKRDLPDPRRREEVGFQQASGFRTIAVPLKGSSRSIQAVSGEGSRAVLATPTSAPVCSAMRQTALPGWLSVPSISAWTCSSVKPEACPLHWLNCSSPLNAGNGTGASSMVTLVSTKRSPRNSMLDAPSLFLCSTLCLWSLLSTMQHG